MKDKIEIIKKQIRDECERDAKLKGWWFESHLLGVEKFAKELLRKFPKANKEVVMLGVWLHDLQRIRRIPGDHEKKGALEATKFLKEYGYSKETIKKVKGIIETHSCENKRPTSLEGKILATADALSVYFKDFFINIAIRGDHDTEGYKEWVMEKLNRNYQKKIFFDFAKKKIKKRQEIIKKFLTMG
jgi:HD superfamily phosphodiesterase